MIIERRFCGPPESANGGYTCGLVAALVEGPAEVTLRAPPPLGRPLDVERSGREARVLSSGTLIAEARPIPFDFAPPPPAPSWAEADAATSRYPWGEGHPYPTCFVCGPARAMGDGLRVFPGAVDGRALAAAPFVADPLLAGDDGCLRSEIVWSLLDCPSWFGMYCFQPFSGQVLLGRLAARIEQRPGAGERCICAGWFIEREGRKIHCGSALYSESGAALAVGRATWIALA